MISVASRRPLPIVAAWLATACLASFAAAEAPSDEAPKSKAPSPLRVENAAGDRFPDDLRIETAAADPEIVDPVDVRFDERGRMWVVENRSFSDDAASNSRIRILEDRDRDGRYETAHTFAENLDHATGLQLWGSGALATRFGGIVYLPDVNGDLRADAEENWFDVVDGDDKPIAMSRPRWAHDGWIYVGCGVSEARVRVRRDDSSDEIDISNGDFRFHPETAGCEAITGSGANGLCFDDFGRRFTCNAEGAVQHVVFEASDLRKSLFYQPPAVVNDLVPDSTTQLRGLNFVRGGALPDRYRDTLWVCDPQRTVHVLRIEPFGATFRATPLPNAERLQWHDPATLPTAVEYGPDGAMYVVDRRRAEQGKSAGRIYRIASKIGSSPRFQPEPSPTQATWIQYLQSDDAWHRELGERRLIAMKSAELEHRLRESFSKTSPRGAFQTSWTLSRIAGGRTFHDLTYIPHEDDLRLREAYARILEADKETHAPPLFSLRGSVLLGGGYQEGFSSRAMIALAPALRTSGEREFTLCTLAYCEPEPFTYAALLLTMRHDPISSWHASFEYMRRLELVMDPKPEFAAHALRISRELTALAAVSRPADELTAWLERNPAERLGQLRPGLQRYVISGVLGLQDAVERTGENSHVRINAMPRLQLADAVAEWSLTACDAVVANPAAGKETLDLIELLRRCDLPLAKEKLRTLSEHKNDTIRAAAEKALQSTSASEPKP